MEKTFVLKAQMREHCGTEHAIRERKQGRIPAIVYGHKLESVAITLDEHDLVEALHHGHRVMEVEIGKKKETMMVKDLQYDHLGKKIIHADLVRVDVSEMVKVNVPIELKGTAIGTHEGGIIEEHVGQLEVECKVTDIPEVIVVFVKEIAVGDNLHAGDVELPAGIKLVSSPDTLVVTCSLVAAAKSTEELEEEAPAAPEVIGEETEETEGGASEQGKET
ncbi:50S ribosomal protein L25 [Planctomycetota bacterium]